MLYSNIIFDMACAHGTVTGLTAASVWRRWDLIIKLYWKDKMQISKTNFITDHDSIQFIDFDVKKCIKFKLTAG